MYPVPASTAAQPSNTLLSWVYSAQIVFSLKERFFGSHDDEI